MRRYDYFVSDVHLGLGWKDPREREQRFLEFLSLIPRESTRALYLLGDIWDFWFEYRDVIPREGSRVVAKLISLMDDGVEVYFCPGNHDIWTFSYFSSLGMKRFDQPFFTTIAGCRFCLGHGDLLGGAKWSYTLMLKVFRNHFAQRVFALLHPWIAYRIGLGWSNSNRRAHKPYSFRGKDEPLYNFCLSTLRDRDVDFFIFGHFHDRVDMPVGETSSRLVVLKDWMGEGRMPCAVFDETTCELRSADAPIL